MRPCYIGHHNPYVGHHQYYHMTTSQDGTNNFDWGTFKEKVFIAGDVNELYSYWATSGGITKFFMKDAQYIDTNGRTRLPDEQTDAGDQYLWKFNTNNEIQGQILEVDPTNCIRFTFGEKTLEMDDYVIVSVEFSKNEKGTWIELIQTNMPTDDTSRITFNISCNMGWQFFLSNLKSIVETGHDLRYTKEDRMDVDAPSGRSIEDFEWQSFSLREYFTLPLDNIFEIWTTKRGLESFFLESAIFEYTDDNGSIIEREPDEKFQTGDKYRWKYHHGLEMTGEVLLVSDNEKLEYTFGPNATVAILFEEDQSKCNIKLHQFDIPDNEEGKHKWNRSCQVGWSFYLTNLRSVIENNYDLRT